MAVDPAARPSTSADSPSPTDAVDAETVAELATRARDGDAGAFAALIERYHRLIFKIAYGKAHDPDDAEDIVQEVFLHAHRSLPKLRDPQAFSSWLVAIAHNRGNRYCRARQNRLRRLEQVRSEFETRTGEQLNQAALAAGERDFDVPTVVSALSEEFRSALIWKYVDGLSYEEIGERLSLSFHQVDYLLRRAKRALKDGIEKQRQRNEGN